MPIEGIAQLTLTTLISLLSFGFAIQMFAMTLGGQPKPKRLGDPVTRLLPQLSLAAAPAVEPAPEPPTSAKASRSALAGLRPPVPEHA